MKKLFLAIMLLIACNFTVAQTIVREGNTFTSVSSTKESKEIKTNFTWKDSKGNEYPIYVGKSGACYIKRVSKKTGKEYKQYLGAEVSSQICKELGIAYTTKK